MDTTIEVRVVVEHSATERGERISSAVGFVVGAANVNTLRARARLVGVAVGAVSSSGEEEDGSAMVQLSMAEIAVGVTEGHLRLVVGSGFAGAVKLTEALTRVVAGSGDDTLLNGNDTLRVRVFVDLWRRGHFVACGSKFGVDFLLYDADPSSCHSFAMVVVKDREAAFATVDIVTHCRVAKMVKKNLLFATQQQSQIIYLSLDHAVLAAAQPDRR